MIKLSKALSIFREEVSTIAKQANNPFFKSKYADLPSILEGIKEPLKKSGLALFHTAENSENWYSLVSTIIETESGESISSSFPLFGSKPQEVWSSLTYARRYNTLALLDIPTDEDDDGNKANTAQRTQKQTVDTPTWTKEYPRTRADDIMDEMKMMDNLEWLKKLFAELYPLAKSDAQKKFYTGFYNWLKEKLSVSDYLLAVEKYDYPDSWH